MSDQHPIIEDPELGVFTRATTELTDGSILTHDWYATTATVDGAELEIMLEGTSADESRARLPRLHEVLADLENLRRIASDAIVTEFSTGDPEPHELDEAASDLTLETIEASADGTVVLHFVDSCGEHFPEGYWPAVYLGAGNIVEDVAVEA